MTYIIYKHGVEQNRIVADEAFCAEHYSSNGYTYQEEKTMTIIKIEPNDNGSHNNQTSSAHIPVPEGWAVVPDDMLPLENYPFGEINVEDVDGVPTVTSWTPLPMPEPEPEPEPDPTEADRFRADLDYIEALLGVPI